MSNSPLVAYTKISKHKTSPRNHKIDTISIHCVVGQLSAEGIGQCFQGTTQSSSNYGIGTDGKIGMYVEEKDRSWCTSSSSNDNRAITIECACDKTHPYAVNDKVMKSLIMLIADICKRNGIPELRWQADKNLIGQVDKQNMTVHRWFKNKACPGDYLFNKHPYIASEVNKLLKGNSTVTVVPPKEESYVKMVKATGTANFRDAGYSNTYKVTASSLNVRFGAGTDAQIMVAIPKGTIVKCYGYYSKDSKGKDWLYVQFGYQGTQYTGFAHSAYLAK